ncbi:unnamed protein product [Alternaria alternata]
MDPSERWQSIAPASDEPGQRRPTSDRRKKRQAVAVACVQCRNGKAKCDGTRPQCNRCKENKLSCQYDVAEGVSRAERMKIMKRDSMTGELDDLKRIVTSLRSGTDDQAAAVLARLRLGEAPEDVAKTLPMTASPATSGHPPRYASLDHSILWLQHIDNPGSAYWARSLRTPLEARRHPQDRLEVEDLRHTDKTRFDQYTLHISLVANPCSIRSNHYPGDIQDTQISNLFLPTWAMLPINTMPDPGSLKRAVPSILQQATSLISMGVSIEQIIEIHPNIAALWDKEVYTHSGILSKWAVGMTHGVYMKGNTFSCFGSMYLFWCLMRWMISPSPETYNAIPEWFRPTPNQLFMPHINIVDFIVWPAFRELVVQIPAMQERMEWMMDLSLNLQCDWSFSVGEALCTSEETGQVDLCDAAREVARDLVNWSVGPSFRGYVSNADSYVRIRTEEY